MDVQAENQRTTEAVASAEKVATADQAASVPAPPSTPLREFVGGLVGVAIALAGVLPPIVHFVTGPLGSLIAGLLVANQLKPGARGRIIIAVTHGLGLASIVALVAAIVTSAEGKSLPSWFPNRELLGLIIAGVFVYGAGLCFAGTLISAAVAANKEKS